MSSIHIHRVPSRNYTNVDNELRRSASVHSVNGEANGPPDSANGDGDFPNKFEYFLIYFLMPGHRALLSPRGGTAPGNHPGSAASSVGGGMNGSSGGNPRAYASTESLQLGSVVVHNGTNGNSVSDAEQEQQQQQPHHQVRFDPLQNRRFAFSFRAASDFPYVFFGGKSVPFKRVRNPSRHQVSFRLANGTAADDGE